MKLKKSYKDKENLLIEILIFLHLSLWFVSRYPRMYLPDLETTDLEVTIRQRKYCVTRVGPWKPASDTISDAFPSHSLCCEIFSYKKIDIGT